MLTKTLRFDDDVLDVLKGLRVERENGGYIGYLEGQLDRDLYVRTNKALEVLGGKWNRKAKGHTFAADPRDALADMLDSGEATVVKDGWFPTPRAVVERMLDLVPVHEHLLLRMLIVVAHDLGGELRRRGVVLREEVLGPDARGVVDVALLDLEVEEAHVLVAPVRRVALERDRRLRRVVDGRHELEVGQLRRALPEFLEDAQVRGCDVIH